MTASDGVKGEVKVHLLDGTYELFRMYYGAPTAAAFKGREVGAVRGLVRSVLKLLREDEATHVGIAFDSVIESFRNELYAGYKTGDGIDADLWAQFPLAEQAMRALGITVWGMVEFEADDALASAAAKFGREASVKQVVIASPDKDLAQCVEGQRVVLWDRRREKVIDEGGVLEKFGVPPESIADLLALTGDAADGVPGIPRWGAKSAASVLSRYRRIEDIPDDAASWDIKVRGAKGLAERLSGARKDAMLYKRLTTLRRDAPIPEALDELRWRGALRAEMEALVAEIGDEAVLDRVHLWRP